MSRPKSLEKRNNRKKCIALTLPASYCLRDIQRQRPRFNFSQYVSERLLADFSDDLRLGLAKYEIGLLNKQKDYIEANILHKVEVISRLKKEVLE